MLLEQKKEKSSTTRGFSGYTNMAAVLLFWNTNMAAVMSCENALTWNLFVNLIIDNHIMVN